MNRRTMLAGVAGAAGGTLVLKASTALAAKGKGGEIAVDVVEGNIALIALAPAAESAEPQIVARTTRTLPSAWFTTLPAVVPRRRSSPP